MTSRTSKRIIPVALDDSTRDKLLTDQPLLSVNQLELPRFRIENGNWDNLEVSLKAFAGEDSVATAPSVVTQSFLKITVVVYNLEE